MQGVEHRRVLLDFRLQRPGFQILMDPSPSLPSCSFIVAEMNVTSPLLMGRRGSQAGRGGAGVGGVRKASQGSPGNSGFPRGEGPNRSTLIIFQGCWVALFRLNTAQGASWKGYHCLEGVFVCLLFPICIITLLTPKMNCWLAACEKRSELAVRFLQLLRSVHWVNGMTDGRARQRAVACLLPAALGAHEPASSLCSSSCSSSSSSWRSSRRPSWPSSSGKTYVPQPRFLAAPPTPREGLAASQPPIPAQIMSHHPSNPLPARVFPEGRIRGSLRVSALPKQLIQPHT